MIQHIVGESIFQKTIRAYLKDRKFKNTNPDYLFEQFQTSTDAANLTLPAPFKIIFESWSDNAGYPMVTVTREKHTSTNIILSQKRFFEKQKDFNTTAEYPNMYVPISIATSVDKDFKNLQPTAWLIADNLTIPGIPKGWFLVNKLGTGFYRVKYDLENWKLLTDALYKSDFDKINVLNRAQLINDAIYMAGAQEQSYSIAFNILFYLRKEKDFVPWVTAEKSLTSLNSYLKGHQNYDRFEVFIQNITHGLYSEVRVITDERRHLVRLNRMSVAKLACLAGLKSCLDDLEELVYRVVIY